MPDCRDLRAAPWQGLPRPLPRSLTQSRAPFDSVGPPLDKLARLLAIGRQLPNHHTPPDHRVMHAHLSHHPLPPSAVSAKAPPLSCCRKTKPLSVHTTSRWWLTSPSVVEQTAGDGTNFLG